MDQRLAFDVALDAAMACCERWGLSKVSIDDIAAEAGLSRATMYRLFPGGKDTLFENLRQRNTNQFFAELRRQVGDADDFKDLLVRVVVAATHGLRTDEHLAVMLAAEPGVVTSELSVAALPRIINAATTFLAPLVAPYIDAQQARPLADLLARLVISYFLAPSDVVDLGDAGAATVFVRAHVLPFALANPIRS